MFQDIRLGLRLLARNPAVTILAALTLGLGIGSTSAIFSVVNAVLLRPLPFRDSERLVWIWQSSATRNIPFSLMRYATYDEWRRANHLFETTSAYLPGFANLVAGDEPERVNTARVNSSFFGMLGVQPLFGRDFTTEDDRPGAPLVAILDYRLFERRFGGDRSVVGRPILLDGQSATVIGVLPPGFEFAGRDVDVYLTIARTPSFTDKLSVGAFGRLKPGASPQRAQAEINAVYRRLEKQLPGTRGWGVRVWGVREFLVRSVRLSLLVLMAAVGLVLLIACGNVAHLLLAAAGTRQTEMAMRVALGTGRARLVRQMLTESALVGLLGGALGILLAWAGVKLLPLAGPAQFPLLKGTAIDLPVLGFTVALSLVTSLLFGAAPALAVSRSRTYETLKSGRGSGESRGRIRFRSALVAAEVAFALLLMIAASLVMRGFLRLQDSSPGFNPEGLLTASVSLSPSRYAAPADRIAFFNRLLKRVAALPGVKVAGMTNLLPLGGINVGMGVLVEGRPAPPPGEVPIAYARVVDPRYFQAMQVPLRRGRWFTEADTGAPRVAIINETMVRRFWPNEDPLGKRFGYGGAWKQVVGVVGDMKHMSLAQPPDAEYFEPYAQNPSTEMALTVRAAGDPMRLAHALRAAVAETAKDQPITRLSSMSQRVADAIAPRRFSAMLLAIFATTALALAVIGIYAVVSFAAARRTHELGIRVALGARPGELQWMMVRAALAPALAGVAIGVAAALALRRVIGSLLYGVSATDPAIFAAVSLLLLAVAAAAGFLPARRAACTAPVTALRSE